MPSDSKRNSTLIIAEAGVNHNGSLERALEMIQVARQAGADAIKFQTFKATELASPAAPKAGYQQSVTDPAESQLEMLRALEFSADQFRDLKSACEGAGICFLSTAFDLTSLDLPRELDPVLYKIPSGEIENLPYLRKIGAFGKEILLSTGMATLEEIGAALEVLIAAGTPINRITVLHCTTAYPTPWEDVNLRAMETIARTFNVQVGYSDHTMGITVPVAAVAMGARVIEKHFTLDRDLPGPDHKASLVPSELTEMVLSIRRTEKALGTQTKRMTDSERENRPVARKSIVAACPINPGEHFTIENLAIKRPGTGVSPMLWDRVLGRTANRKYGYDEPLTVQDLQDILDLET